MRLAVSESAKAADGFCRRTNAASVTFRLCNSRYQGKHPQVTENTNGAFAIRRQRRRKIEAQGCGTKPKKKCAPPLELVSYIARNKSTSDQWYGNPTEMDRRDVSRLPDGDDRLVADPGCLLPSLSEQWLSTDLNHARSTDNIHGKLFRQTPFHAGFRGMEPLAQNTERAAISGSRTKKTSKYCSTVMH
jgi:hypothetical protein